MIPGMPLWGNKDTQLTPEQAWATRDDFQKAYPEAAARYRYTGAQGEHNAGSPYEFGRSIRKYLQNPNAINSVLNSGILGAGGAGAAIGGLLAGGASWLRNRFVDEEDQRDPIQDGLLGAGAGFGLGGYLGYVKGSSYFKARSPWEADTEDPQDTVRQMLAVVPGIDPSQRYDYMRMAGQLSSSDAQQLMLLLRTVAGAGAGALIARFFLGKGMGKAVAGALLGGAMARLTARPQKSNTDFYGRPYLY
jgi:hypothetical protein